jgi:N utilization substance protein B
VQGRRRARSLILQALYEIDCTAHAVEEVLDRHLNENPLSTEAETFFRTLIYGVLEHQGKIDVLIHRYAPEWPVSQMAIIDRSILRMAIYELAFLKQTPQKVVINEAVELAKLYASDNAPRFVNGVLGTLAGKQDELRDLCGDTGSQVIQPDDSAKK